MIFIFRLRCIGNNKKEPSGSFLIEDKLFLETFLKWVRTLGEIIQWMISAIQEVPWLSFEPKVSKLPSSRNNPISSTFLTAESFSVCLNEPICMYQF